MISSHDDFKKTRPTSFRPLHGGLYASASGRWRLGHFERCRLVGARLAAFLWLADSPDGRRHSLRTQPSLDRIVCRRSEEHTSELQSPCNLVCRLLLEKKKKKNIQKDYVCK